MSIKSLKILVIFDLAEEAPFTQDYSESLKTEDWKTENDVITTLLDLNHEVRLLGLFDDISPLIHELKNHPPDLVFNLCETLRNDRKLEPHIVSLLELYNVKYTGCSSHSLFLCKDKGLSKKILTYHRIKVPQFEVSHLKRPLKGLGKFHFPAMIKPIDLEGSEGINEMSYVENEKDALERVKFLHDKFKTDVIIEEYINGKEIYLGMIGNEKITPFKPWEVFFEQMSDEDPKIATYKVKWDLNYRKKWGIKNALAKDLSKETILKMNDVCKKIYKIFLMRGYGRIDLRVKENGEIYFIEANPNPCLAIDEDFASSGIQSGFTYKEIISKILNLSGV